MIIVSLKEITQGQQILIGCSFCGREDSFQEAGETPDDIEKRIHAMHCPSCKKAEDGSTAELTCWSCKTLMSYEDRGQSDGNCPYCHCEIDLDD